MSSRSKSWFRAPRASVAALLTCLGCASGSSAVSSRPSSPEAPSMKSSPSRPELVARLVARHGEAHRARIERGVAQVAALWREEDGDLEAFVTEYFIPDEAALDATLARLEQAFEQLDGHLNEVGRELRRPTDLDLGPLLPVDALLAAYDPSAHVTEDLFRAKVGFVALLNFPLTTLAERMEQGPGYTRRQWAEVRLTGRFSSRVPAEVRQEATRASAAADLYIAEYNLWMHHLVDAQGRRLFPKGMRLISHWNLRDELKSRYADPDGVAKQRMIIQVMSRIVTQTIPAAVIDNPRVDWDPFTNTVKAAPAEEVEADAPQRPVGVDGAREDDVRYAKLLAHFHAARKQDPYVPVAPTAIARSFELARELPEARVKALLEQVLTSPLVPRVAKVIEQRLGRKLEPQELWYAGFKANATRPEAELDALTRKRYPNAEAYARDMPRLLQGLGFSKEKATFLAEHIRVDPARGAGHAMQAARRGDFPRLRTRVGPGGMDYKGYNIAVHEMGHNVEQVFSLYNVDHTLLAGVPNNAFTEALAFVFQARDMELLGMAKPDAASERERVLNDFWQTWEIAGVALVDIAVWHWMYEHPDATPASLREAVVRIAQETWDRYYAPVLGGQGTPLLGIYSHMISYPLYLADYPLGHLIAFQIEEHLQKSGKLGAEFERMASQGALTPDVWMTKATGAPVSAEPLLHATEKALGQ
ncbi:hypothetical protein D187_007737 [Cystobacter fuscus DSM 2262]|uniref:Oligoendopeptidase F n=2 Tax=Cystobacter fuscus TaxID=43 RepID=S9NW04_CYSF2|nr:hypothetical protein D187_007737 [Cystobacter fuscus DSM 2262]